MSAAPSLRREGAAARTHAWTGKRAQTAYRKLPACTPTLDLVTTAQPEASLLVVEDEPNIRELLATSLRFAGFEVHVAGDGATALNLATQHDPDLVVLDVMLPDMDGFTVTRKLRDTGRQLPIVFVTARDSVDDKIKGLTVGGDDYVTKPFSLEEVVARIRAVLRRTRGEVDESAALRFEDLELDEDSHEVRRAGRVIDTSPTEFKLLRYLMLNPNRVLSKAQILDHVWDYDFRGESGIVESYISYLRRKIDTEGMAPLIHTKRGVGYVLRKPPEA
jgi:two-component system OmpR family response regulator